ncbi:hypothetical protein PRZ48_009048 [Zasmidium cellare]|uniref:glutathione transferase n=1 Tax=Zasmidium cellare TaxID=395010 RepID=A0ABR0EHY9_ZASCE|nr:hypothetical protein PRZ48_009048 [Zasmidium cellare]
MPAFTLHGTPGSTNTERVLLTLHEGSFTDYEFAPVDLRTGAQKSPSHLALHPLGKVPAITFPDGFTLAESRAISKYLARKYSFPLLPPATNLEATALFEQAESLETLYFGEPAGKIGFEKFAKKLFGAPTDEKVVKQAEKELGVFLDVAGSVLLKGGYFGGKEFSLIDIYYIPLVQRLYVVGHGHLIESRPVVKAWWEWCTARPAVKTFLEEAKKMGPQLPA